MNSVEPSRPDKILLAMHTIANGTTRPCKYEDIVVKAFEMFSKDFQLRGYPQYPDSSDIHKPLYGPLKRMGLVRAANKTFSLTDKGKTRAEELENYFRNGNHSKRSERLSRDIETEIARLRKTSAFQFFLEKKPQQILDIDFYSYLGVTVRTGRNDFLGRLTAVSDAIEAAVKAAPESPNTELVELHKMLLSKFDKLIHRKKEEKP